MLTKIVTINDACPIILLHMHHIMIGIQTLIHCDNTYAALRYMFMHRQHHKAVNWDSTTKLCNTFSVICGTLRPTYWGLNIMVAIMQTTISHAFCWIMFVEIWSKYHWNFSEGPVDYKTTLFPLRICQAIIKACDASHHWHMYMHHQGAKQYLHNT